MHDKGIIHRDIKPDNILNDCDKLTLIDFGLGKIFRNKPPTSQKSQGTIGTILFASVNSLKGQEQSRRDDIEGLFYTLAYLQLGKLPWSDLNFLVKSEKIKTAIEMKELYYSKGLWKTLPNCVLNILKHAKNLAFESKPDYASLRENIKQEITSTNIFLLFQEIDLCQIRVNNNQTQLKTHQMVIQTKKQKEQTHPKIDKSAFETEDESPQLDISCLNRQIVDDEGLKKPTSPKKVVSKNFQNPLFLNFKVIE